MALILRLAFLFTLCHGIFGGKRCDYYIDDDNPDGGMTSMYCSTGCCGDLFDQECCDEMPAAASVQYISTEMIVLIVLGCLLAAVILIVTAIAIVVCLRRKQREQQRTAPNLQPHQNMAFTDSPLRATSHLSVSTVSLPPSYEEAIQEPCYSSMSSVNTVTDQSLASAPPYDVKVTPNGTGRTTPV